jgi:membrane protein
VRNHLRVWRRSRAFAFAAGLYRRFNDANVALLSAGLTFYAAFSLGPLLLLLGGWLAVALRGQPEAFAPYREALTDLVTQVIPVTEDADALIQTSIDLILAQLADGAVMRMIFSVIVLLWASSSFFTSLQHALEVIFEVRRGRPYLRKRLVALLLLLAVVVLLVVEVIGSVLGELVSEALQTVRLWAESVDLALPEPAPPVGFSPLRLLATASIFTLCFRLLPRGRGDWVAAAIGGTLSTIALVVIRQILMATFSLDRFNLVYGVITGVVVLLMWLYLTMLGFLLGAVLAAEIAAWRRRDREPHGAPVPADPG